jgi:hypothetical protein
MSRTQQDCTTTADSYQCEKCSGLVVGEYWGNPKPDGTEEYLCEDCPSDHTGQDDHESLDAWSGADMSALGF